MPWAMTINLVFRIWTVFFLFFFFFCYFLVHFFLVSEKINKINFGTFPFWGFHLFLEKDFLFTLLMCKLDLTVSYIFMGVANGLGLKKKIAKNNLIFVLLKSSISKHSLGFLKIFWALSLTHSFSVKSLLFCHNFLFYFLFKKQKQNCNRVDFCLFFFFLCLFNKTNLKPLTDRDEW